MDRSALPVVRRGAEPTGGGSSIELPNAESSPTALRAPVTPTAGFFVRSHSAIPAVDASRWRLRIGGLVRRPTSWDLAELRERARTRVTAVLECAGNSRRRFPHPAPGELRWGDRAVGSAEWTGVPLSALLAEAGLSPQAKVVVFSGAEKVDAAGGVRRFSRSLSVPFATRGPDLLVATEMNGRPLSPEHGWPVRLVVPGWYGMAWVKWLSTIRVAAAPFRGYYQASRYVYRYRRGGRTITEPVDALRVKSLILGPVEGERLRRGRSTVVFGKAWTGSATVSRVEVDVGSGWQEARSTAGQGPFDWSRWAFRWRPSRPGPVTVRARATDTSGATQPEAPVENTFQYAANSIHSVGVEIT
jgi:DMSO/TMAO reductase YedYZ molybdopterin-dependent catalytic subunit